MRVDDEVAHQGVIHRRLSLAAPSGQGLLVAGVGAHQIDLFQVAEFGRSLEALQLDADNQVQELFRGHAIAFVTDEKLRWALRYARRDPGSMGPGPAPHNQTGRESGRVRVCE